MVITHIFIFDFIMYYGLSIPSCSTPDEDIEGAYAGKSHRWVQLPQLANRDLTRVVRAKPSRICLNAQKHYLICARLV